MSVRQDTPVKQLLLGAGTSRIKVLGQTEDWDDLTTLDFMEDSHPDIVWDLNEKPWPIEDNSFDEIHAYEVLEHLGSQGDWRAFFSDFTECWRILVPDGCLYATVPSLGSPWVWGDPSHTRYIGPESVNFLSQKMYEQNVGRTPMSDFRSVYKADFEILGFETADENRLAFALKAIKQPSVVKQPSVAIATGVAKR